MVCIPLRIVRSYLLRLFLVVRELPVLSLANPGMDRIVDSSTAEYTSMLLNCRDGSLAQQLAHKLSIVANTATSM